MKQCTEAPSNIQHANVNARVYVRAKAKRVKAFMCEAYANKERYVFKVHLNTDVLTKLYGIITQCHFLLHLTLQTYVDTENLMIIDGHTLPCYFADSFCKSTTKPPYTLVWFSDNFCLILHYKTCRTNFKT